MIIRNERFNYLYLSILITSGFMLFTATGPILTGGHGLIGWFNSWQRYFFAGACHQDIFRTIIISETPMAVCSRCYGIYSGIFAGMLAGPFINSISILNFRFFKLFLILSVILIFIHVVGEISGFWVSSNITRFITGSSLGLSVAVIISHSIIHKK